MQLQQRQDTKSWFLSQEGKQKWNKIKVGIFTAMFFNAIFLLTQHSSFFQIITWNWKHLTNQNMQAKKVFWRMTLHSYLCNALCKLFPKHSEIKSMGPISSSKEEIVFSPDSNELFVQRFLKVFNQNWKLVEVQNQRTGTPAHFTVSW